jgi:hypothetical protein
MTSERRKRPQRYNRQVIAMLDDTTADRIAADADRNQVSKSDVVRTYIDAGIAAAEEKSAVYVDGRLYVPAETPATT